jgi:integration host factor subunit alpha
MADGSPTNFSSDVVGKTLTKAEFVESVYSRVGLSRRDSSEVVELLFECIKETLARGEAVKISGFGNFVVREKNARIGRNPQTGRDIEISARRVLTFKPSQVLKDILNR